tara:strand:+ start:468 stop:1409 length:942 start_codon:yes stop_codon:yes gene_type:complete
MEDFEEAPYLELDYYKPPEGVNSVFIPMHDKRKLRLMYWKSNKDNELGTVLLQQGHNEFIEKYYETIQEFLDRNYNVVAFDWRGQGMSERMINHRYKQHIEDFQIHDCDIKYIFSKVLKHFTKPFIGVGHSMGGFILLSTLKKNQIEFDKIILSAPMLGFRSEKLLMKMIDIFFFLLPKSNFVPGSNPNMGKETPFEENDLTTDKFRYQRTQMLVRLKKDIRLWGVTLAWAKAVKNQLLIIRKDGWAETINNKILFLNNTNDKVVSSKQILKMSKRLKNSQIVNFEESEHEIFMEKDELRKKMWSSIDNFLKN